MQEREREREVERERERERERCRSLVPMTDKAQEVACCRKKDFLGPYHPLIGICLSLRFQQR